MQVRKYELHVGLLCLKFKIEHLIWMAQLLLYTVYSHHLTIVLKFSGAAVIAQSFLEKSAYRSLLYYCLHLLLARMKL